ncbi:MAG: dihydrolipoyl dehydrogenase [Bacteroidales bacterium]|nr:dihydrolipoyl dehydrogenase [Bacteroidales bacterium]MDZ4204064.1 dihydrolipoyl dehydrogenase [Bacteroidales bacterium]
MNYDLIVIGSGPGGYVAAIRASQLGMKTAVIERSELGGVCLNWGCIPTKALLKSAQVFNYLNHASDYGVTIKGETGADLAAMVSRSRNVAAGMSKGIEFLFKKNQIEHIAGTARVKPGKIVEVSDSDGNIKNYSANHIIIATGARSRELPELKQDGKKVIGYREAMTLTKQPATMVVVGSGAIGSEFAYFYNSIGTQVTLVEFMPTILPVEDEEVSKQLERSFKKQGIKVKTSSSVESVVVKGDICSVDIKTKKGIETIETEIVLSAVGITPNTENLGLKDTGIKVENGRIIVDEFFRTNIEGYYAIGDVIPGPALAHLASHEGIVCVEKIAGKHVEPINYGNVPGCTYTNPEVASVGMTETKAREAGYEIKIGKFPFTASGKASASGSKDGFVKLIFDAKYGELLGAHLIGDNVTEMIAELVMARKLETTAEELIKGIHPHPTMSEAVMEAAAAAYDEVIHL